MLLPDKRLIALNYFKEESPGSTKTQCQLMAGGGNPRDSATENKPPNQGKGETAREELTGFLVTKNAWQTPLGARLNREDTAFDAKNSL